MMKLNNKILLLAVFMLGMITAEDITLEEITELRSDLIETYEDYLTTGISREVDLYPLALYRLDMALQEYSGNSGSEEAQREFEMVEFVTEAARVQMLAAKNYAVSLDLQEETESILREINMTRKQINSIELEIAEKKETELAEALARQRSEAEQKLADLEGEMIRIDKDVRGTIISMSDLLFKTGSADLTGDLKTNLARIGGILLIYPELEIVIEGHTDNVGSLTYNQELSQLRADNVKGFLVDMGVLNDRMNAIGCAFSKPVFDNETPEGRSKNRRVDIIIKN